MINRTNILPPGTVAVKNNDGMGGILNYVIMDDGRVMFPLFMDRAEVSLPSQKVITWSNVFNPSKYHVISKDNAPYDDLKKLYDLAQKNYEQNKDSITGPYEYKQQDTVIICGAGPSLKADIECIKANRSRACIITLNRAQSIIQGDYFMECEPHDRFKMFKADKFKPERTHAVLCTTAPNSFVRLPWRKISWFSFNYDFEDNPVIPIYKPGRHITFGAFQFAVNQLHAKKIIFTGMDYTAVQNGHNTKYLDAILIQSLAFFASRQTEVWNVSHQGIFTNGVLIGTMDEALSKEN